MRKVIPIVLLALGVSACTPPLEAGNMTPMTQVYSQIPANPELEHKVKLGQVTVYDQAGAGIAPVTPDIFREALQSALLTSNFGVRGGAEEKYVLDAHLLALDVPMFGFDMTAAATARYVLRTADGSETVIDKTLSLPYTAEFAEAFDGSQRVRIAVAKAIRENITHMIRLLADQTKETLKPHG